MLKKILVLLLASLSWDAGAVTQNGSGSWHATDGEASWLPDLPGWRCVQSIALPFSSKRVAVCRDSGYEASAELWLLLVDRRQTGAFHFRELARLRDASRIRMRLYSAKASCPRGATSCMNAILLVDQLDEASCYGTQVVVMPAGQQVRPIGFIDEVRGGDDAGACVGRWAEVRSAAGGAVIYLPAPLMTVDPNGVPSPLAASSITYSINAAEPVLQRHVETLR